ncbi:MAG: outer membrane protein assembly factor BamA [Fibrobacterota bacterium]
MRKVYLVLLLPVLLTAARIETIQIDGVSPEEEQRISASLPFSAGDEYTSQDGAKAVRTLYSTGRFRDIEVRTDTTADRKLALTLTVEPVPYCDLIEIEGNDEFSEKRIRDSLSISRGMRATEQLIFENRRIIKKMYAEKGYTNAQVRVEETPSSISGYSIFTFKIEENERIYIDEIIFKGNEHFSDRRLRLKFKTDRKHIFSRGIFNRKEYEGHLDSLEQYYKNKGYINARVANDTVEYIEDSTALRITITMDEGRRYYAGNVFFEGNKVFSDQRLMQGVILRPGDVFEQKKFQQMNMQIGDIYRNDGYLYSRVEPRLKYRDDTVDVIYSITEGKPAIVGKVIIAGNSKTRERVIRRNIRIYPGDIYSQAAIKRSIRELNQLQYFKSVQPDILPRSSGSNVVDIQFRVVEKDNLGQFSAGVTYSGDGGFGGNLSVKIPNFRGAGEELDVKFQHQQERDLISAKFTKPWIFNEPISFTGRTYWEKADYEDARYDIYDYERLAVEAGLGRRLSWPDDYWSGSFRYLIGKDKYNRNYEDTENLLGIDVIASGVLSRLYLNLTRDDKDRPTFPTRGSSYGVSAYLGGIGGDYNYLKTIVNYEWHLPLFWKFTMGTKGKIGMINPLHGDDVKLGYNDLFRVGGVYYDGILRGYNESDFQEDLNMMTISGQISFPVVEETFYLAGFLDAGNSFNQMRDLGRTMYMGTGFGFRLMLPMVGLMGFDFAVPLNDVNALGYEKEGPRDWTTHFIMNKDF